MPHTAFVLAAGFGTRLQPLTNHRPKPLVPVCGVPMLAYCLALCARHGLTDVVVNAHHLADQLVAWNGTHEGVTVRVHVESPDILGTGGGLRAVLEDLAPVVAVVNGDILADVDLAALVANTPQGGGCLALRAHAEDAQRYGVVAADSESVIVKLRTMASANPVGEVAYDTHFTGLHAIHRDAVATLAPGESCVVRQAYKYLVPERRVQGLRHTGLWCDVGDPAAYLATNLDMLAGRIQAPIDPFERAGPIPPGVQVHGTCWIGPGATVAPGTVLRDAIVGHGAVVCGGTLERVVVWDGVTVPNGRHTNGIWHDGGFAPVPARPA